MPTNIICIKGHTDFEIPDTTATFPSPKMGFIYIPTNGRSRIMILPSSSLKKKKKKTTTKKFHYGKQRNDISFFYLYFFDHKWEWTMLKVCKIIFGYLKCLGGSVSLTWFWLRSWSQGREMEPCVGLCAEYGICSRFSSPHPTKKKRKEKILFPSFLLPLSFGSHHRKKKKKNLKNVFWLFITIMPVSD